MNRDISFNRIALKLMIKRYLTDYNSGVKTRLTPVMILAISLSANLCFGQYSRKEEKIAKNTLATVLSTKGLYEDKYLQAWIEQIGRSLEVKIEQHYDFKYYLVDDPEPNAFATTGGNIFINRGLLVYTNTSDELAGILSHEMIHIINHHVSKRVTANVLPNLLQLPGNVIGLLTYKEVAKVINAPIKAAAGLITNAYSRTQEKEADLLGVQLAFAAGYDPFALIDILERINSDTKSGSFKALFQDHPLTSDRSKEIRDELQAMGLQASLRPVGTQLNFLDRLPVDQNPKAGIVDGALFIHPDLDFAFELPSGWNYQNSPTSLSAVSHNKKSTLIVSVDHTRPSPSQAAYLELRNLKRSNVILSAPDTINGLHVYRATIRDRRIKYADLISEILWLKIPTTQTVIKVVGISNFNHPNESILDSFHTFRQITEYDLEDTKYPVLRLRYTNPNESLSEYLSRTGQEWQQPLLETFNSMKPDAQLPNDHYLKTIQLTSVK